MSAAPGYVYLMYHEIERPGRPLCRNETGYVRYIVSESDFRDQMYSLRDSGSRGMKVGEALLNPGAPGVVITFDDGSETDLIIAAPLLRELGFDATCYVTVGFLEKRGYLSRKQLREMGDLGLEIGSHSMTHPYLSDLSQEQLTYEISGSKQELEQITGCPVHHFSCPGGRWDPRVAATARQAGYRSVATSQASTNPPNANPDALGRIAILRGTDLGTFQALSNGRGLWKIRLKDSVRSSARRLLGNSAYDRARRKLLEWGPGSH